MNVDNLRWKMIGVCLHQPQPRPKPARIAHLACHAARTTWARRALEGARPSCRLSGLRRPAPIIRERVNAGLARARAKGTKLGRRPVKPAVEGRTNLGPRGWAS